MRTEVVKGIMVFFVVLAVSGCGVKSSPVAPEGATYPAQYPAALPTFQVKDVAPARSYEPAPAVSDPKSFWQYPNTPPTQ